MTKTEAVSLFKETVLPGIKRSEQRYGFSNRIDEVMRREAWNNFTDMLCKARTITSYQYETWVHPACCGR